MAVLGCRRFRLRNMGEKTYSPTRPRKPSATIRRKQIIQDGEDRSRDENVNIAAFETSSLASRRKGNSVKLELIAKLKLNLKVKLKIKLMIKLPVDRCDGHRIALAAILSANQILSRPPISSAIVDDHLNQALRQKKNQLSRTKLALQGADVHCSLKFSSPDSK
ncbi:unnamed protein product, partial [Nesidiocoris tenuis]